VYGYPLGVWISFGLMDCHLGLYVSFGFIDFFGVYICICYLSVYYCNDHSKLCIPLWEWGEMCIAQRAREELLQNNPFFTTTTTEVIQGLSDIRSTEIQG
jgi:hypothetical protein